MSSDTANELIERLLELPIEDRAAAAERLLESLHPQGEELSSDELAEAWLPELQRRIEASDSGAEPSVPHEQAWPRIVGERE